MRFTTELIWNTAVVTCSLDELCTAVENDIRIGGTVKTLLCANPHSLVTAAKDPEFLSALQSADYLIPDGIGVVYASILQGGNIRTRVTGSDVLATLSGYLQRQGKFSYFFLGSTGEVLRKIETRMQQQYPGIRVTGYHAPPFGETFSDDENERMIRLINEAAPSVLWVGLTAPKQEKWIAKHRHRLNVSMLCAVGAAFDYFAGSKKRAPVWMQHAGLEWLPRLLREPGRMWRRNIISTPVFLYHILKQKTFHR